MEKKEADNSEKKLENTDKIAEDSNNNNNNNSNKTEEAKSKEKNNEDNTIVNVKLLKDNDSSTSSSSKIVDEQLKKASSNSSVKSESSSSLSSSKTDKKKEDNSEKDEANDEKSSSKGSKSSKGSSKKKVDYAKKDEIIIAEKDAEKQPLIPDTIGNLAPVLKRRGTMVEETEESLRQAKEIIEQEGRARRKNSLKESWGEVRRGIYDSEYREFLARDSKGWFKLSFFYFIFFTCLAGFFCLLLYLFYQFLIDPKKPNYFYKESVMHYKEINPGLGFRPHVDVETELITKYENGKSMNFTGAHGRKQTFNYRDAIKNSPCSRENNFGYNSSAPCVIIKLNRLYGWLPKASSKAPGNLSKVNSDDKFVFIKCEGEHGTDKDNIHELNYYSSYPNQEIGGIPFKYFPYRNQPGYLSPLVFVHFKNVTTNVLINVVCKAYAHNIDNKDRRNKRGMVNFQLFIS